MSTPLDQYTRIAQDAAAQVITGYSTSFSMATRLLPRRCRTHITSVYALVRVADEIVDGVGEAAGLSVEQQRHALNALEAEVEAASASGFSSNVVVHAFARAARDCGITREQTRPFFHSMEMDLDPRALDEDEQQEYVHGSAEVVGLMCLRVFLAGQGVSDEDTARLDEGARALGAAFQNVNFLRDLADDTTRGRDYLPTEADTLTEQGKDAWVSRIRADFEIASRTIPLLPRDCRAGVGAARALFAELTRRIDSVPLSELRRVRVSVPATTKARIISTAVLKESPWRG
ncbi:MAG: phytoene/squalene synthase family protein [Mycetocola sp.]